MKPRRTQAQRRAETRAALLESARRLFGRNGYGNTSLEEIAAACGLTIRPIYHYFGNKQRLFLAVHERMEEQIVAELRASADDRPDDPVLAAWRAFLALCRDPEFRRVVLVDGANVLGRERWKQSAVTATAAELIRHSVADAEAPTGELVGRMLLGAVAEAALTIADSEDPEAASREADEAVTRLVHSLLDLQGSAGSPALASRGAHKSRIGRSDP